jgi:hypothetical protein
MVLFRVQTRDSDDDRSRIAELVDRRETSLATTVFILIGAVSYIVGHAGGLYWLVPAILLSLVAGVINAWLFLIGDVV